MRRRSLNSFISMKHSFRVRNDCLRKRSVYYVVCQASIEKSEASTLKGFFFRLSGFWEMLEDVSQRFFMYPPTWLFLRYAQVGVWGDVNAYWYFTSCFDMVCY